MFFILFHQVVHFHFFQGLSTFKTILILRIKSNAQMFHVRRGLRPCNKGKIHVNLQDIIPGGKTLSLKIIGPPLFPRGLYLATKMKPYLLLLAAPIPNRRVFFHTS